MDPPPVALQAELLGRLALSVVLGGVLGWERQMGQHPAGLRTHILVALGAAAFTIAGTYGAVGLGTVHDAGRVAAQIVTGIGFLGAGTIWRSGSDRIIYGLTTAASIWVAASLGMLAGFGLYVLAVGCAVLGFAVLRLLKELETAPLAFRRPRLRRAAAGAAARGAQPVPATPGDVASAPPYRALPAAAAEGEAEAEPREVVAGADGSKRSRSRKKDRPRKKKRRDAELETMAAISDAPRT
jgi:putative Mg2+ transporter-C (MgtC) family protein